MLAVGFGIIKSRPSVMLFDMREYQWDVKNDSRMGRYLTGLESGFVRSALNSLPNVQNIIDVGGGSGRLALPLACGGYRVIVTESDMRPLSTIRSVNQSLDAILVGGGSKCLPFRNSSVDCILAIQVPFLTQPWFLPECCRVLTPHGLVIFNAANAHSYKGFLLRLQAKLRARERRAQTWAPYAKSACDILRLVESHGLHIEEAVGYNWLPAQRGSNARWIPLAASIEHRLGLCRLPHTSPWVLFRARRVPRTHPKTGFDKTLNTGGWTTKYR